MNIIKNIMDEKLYIMSQDKKNTTEKYIKYVKYKFPII